MIYDFIVKDNEGRDVSLREFEGQVILIVNTATECGFTPQYEGLEALYEKYKDRGFVILDFPCNQFGGQAPGSADEIKSFCSLNFGTTFPQFEKVDVNGENESPLFTYLKSEQKGVLGGTIKWNFTKFLIDRDGNVLDRFAPSTKPEKIESKIEELLLP